MGLEMALIPMMKTELLLRKAAWVYERLIRFWTPIVDSYCLKILSTALSAPQVMWPEHFRTFLGYMHRNSRAWVTSSAWSPIQKSMLDLRSSDFWEVRMESICSLVWMLNAEFSPEWEMLVKASCKGLSGFICSFNSYVVWLQTFFL